MPNRKPPPSNVVNLQQAKEALILEQLKQPGRRLWLTWTEPAQYMVEPCRVISLPVRQPVSPVKP